MKTEFRRKAPQRSAGQTGVLGSRCCLVHITRYEPEYRPPLRRRMGDPRQCRDLLRHAGPSRLSRQKNRDFGAAIGIAGSEQYLCVTAELCHDHPMTHALQ